MTNSGRPRGFLAPFIGVALVFAVLGPPTGGVIFVPLVIALKAPAVAGAFALATVVASAFGHWIMVFAAYVLGVGPATATGVLYALWDAAAPERWPRALVAAVIGGFVAYAVALRLAEFGVSLDMMFDHNLDAPSVQSISMTAPVATQPVSTESGLVRAFVASGAIAALVCALAASLLGLSMRPTPLRPGTEGAV